MNTPTDKAGTPGLRRGVRQAVPVRDGAAVHKRLLYADRSVPLLITPVLPGSDLASWAVTHREEIAADLATHGGLLFRGFDMAGQEPFERFLDATGLQRMHYVEGATPRTELGHQVYTSTEFPHEHPIALHNELSYAMTWPTRIAFCCLTPAASGGETPIADVRRVLARIPSHVRDAFAERQWMLVRNFGDGLSLSWQAVYRTSDRTEVERYCRASAIDWEWKGETRLRTWQVRPAITAHPRSGEGVWFNHVAFWHVSSLDANTRSLLLADLTEAGLPYNTYYGDGRQIADDVIDELRRAYNDETVRFAWQPGDVLYLDNMLVAHGRGPYTGARRVIVAMGDPCTRETGTSAADRAPA
jgi:alpha-ketoglutarate-dependent taurine dioxygenase